MKKRKAILLISRGRKFHGLIGQKMSQTITVEIKAGLLTENAFYPIRYDGNYQQTISDNVAISRHMHNKWIDIIPSHSGYCICIYKP